jgi:hypothetical protein
MTKTFIGIAIVATALACGCASNPTRSTGVVALEIPEPPPKPDILPVPAPEAPPERPVAAPVERPATVPAARPSPPAQTNAGTQSAPQAPAGPVPAPEAPPTPAPELRPAGTAAKSLTGAQVRESLDRTKQKLDAIDRRRLNAGKRADYDSARRFLAQADTAVRANNLLLAQSSVEKAEALANGLR